MNEMSTTLPSKTLWQAAFSAAVIAAGLLVLVVLPAEYNIDPVGTGEALGLTRLAEPAAMDTPVAPAAPQTGTTRKDTVTIDVPAGKGIEYKLHLLQGSKLTYQWSAEGGTLEFDFHGEPQGDTTGYFESYALSNGSEISGSLTAPFEGSHGWYWKNHTSTPIKISLTMAGVYDIIGLK